MMLMNMKICDHSCRAARKTIFRVTKVGSAELKTAVNGREVIMDLTDVYYAKTLLKTLSATV